LKSNAIRCVVCAFFIVLLSKSCVENHALFDVSFQGCQGLPEGLPASFAMKPIVKALTGWRAAK
jgi:hypothetical protein